MKKRAMFLMVITAIMWSIGGIFIKLISWSPLLIAGARSAISGSVMAVSELQAPQWLMKETNIITPLREMN